MLPHYKMDADFAEVAGITVGIMNVCGPAGYMDRELAVEYVTSLDALSDVAVFSVDEVRQSIDVVAAEFGAYPHDEMVSLCRQMEALLPEKIAHLQDNYQRASSFLASSGSTYVPVPRLTIPDFTPPVYTRSTPAPAPQQSTPSSALIRTPDGDGLVQCIFGDNDYVYCH